MNRTEFNSALAAIDAGNCALVSIEQVVKTILNQAHVIRDSRDSDWDRIEEYIRGMGIDDASIFQTFKRLDHIDLNRRIQVVHVSTYEIFRGETNHSYCNIPYAWITASIEERQVILTAEFDRLLTTVDRYDKMKEDEAEVERRAEYERLREEFGDEQPRTSGLMGDPQ